MVDYDRIMPRDTRVIYGDNILGVNTELSVRNIIVSIAEIFPELMGATPVINENVIHFNYFDDYTARYFKRSSDVRKAGIVDNASAMFLLNKEE